MAHELAPIDITTVQDFLRLVDEVHTTGRARRLQRDHTDLAVLQPAHPTAGPWPDPTPRRPAVTAPWRPRFPPGGIVAATAGIVQYDGPVLSRDEESAAFEQALAEDAGA